MKLLAMIGVLLTACGAENTQTRCVTGSSVACACDNSSPGVQTCRADGTLSPCRRAGAVCVDPSATADGGSSAVVDGGAGPLAPPTGVVGGGSDTMNILLWNASRGATGYRVLRSIFSGGPLTALGGPLEASQLSYVDLDVSEGTSYRYQVVALNAAGDTAPASPFNVVSRGVAATATATVITDSGSTPIPADLRNSTGLTLLYGSGSSFTTVLPVGTTDGYLVFPGVPSSATYNFCFGEVSSSASASCYVTSTRTLDLSWYQMGRLNAARATVNPTNLNISLTGLSPWDSSGSWLNLHSVGPNSEYSEIDTLRPPAASATAFSATWNLAPDWNLFVADQVFITQVEPLTTGTGWRYNSATRVFSGTATVANGGRGALAGAMSTAPTLLLSSVEIMNIAFKSYMTAVNPAAEATGDTGFRIYAAPAFGSGGWFGFAGYMGGASYSNLEHRDYSIGSLNVGRPFPATWDVFIFAWSTFGVSFTLPGATTPLTWYVGMGLSGLRSRTSMSDLGPRVSPPQQPKLNGLNAFSAPAGGVGTRPTFSWMPPALGTPTNYLISIYRLSVNASGAVEAARVIDLWTAATSLQLPDGVLTAGSVYFAQIRAEILDVNPLTSPFRKSTSTADGNAVTHSFTP